MSKIENISPQTATTIIRDYDPSSGQTAGEHLNGVDEAYAYGYYNYSEADMKAGKFTPKLTDTQRKSAYVLGQNERSNLIKVKTPWYYSCAGCICGACPERQH